MRRGYLLGFGAYVLWGFFPLYWKFLRPATAVEILAHRIVWSVACAGLLVVALRNWRSVAEVVRKPRALGGVSIAAVLVGINWCTYIYGVNSDRVVETSLGYFINPLVTVVLGVAVLSERLRPAQWGAVGIGAVAVGVLTVDYGQLPWIALTLAVTFGLYGLTKKSLGLPAVPGLFVESAVLALPALGYLGWLVARDASTFGHVSALQTTLLVLSGAVTAIPLLMFASAANLIPLSALGLLQYTAPILQLACGVLIYREPMPPARLAGFALVWLALAVFSWDGIRYARNARTAAAEPAPAG